MLTAKLISSAGLVLDIVGVCILFKFGFPQPDHTAEVILVTGQTDPDAPRRRIIYIAMSSIGLISLVGGFALQLWALWM